MGLVLEHLEKASSGLVFLDERIEAVVGSAEVKGHPLRNEFVRLTKRCIAGIKRGDRSLVPQVRGRLPTLPQEFEEFGGDKLFRLFSRLARAELVETSQAEGVECLYFDAYHPFLFGGKVEVLPDALTPESLGVSDQAHCNGLVDLTGELAKAVLDWRALREPRIEEEIFVLQRFLDIARDVVTFLSRIEGVPEKYIAVTGRESDYRGTFYGKLIGAKRHIVEHRLALEQLKLWQRLERRYQPA